VPDGVCESESEGESGEERGQLAEQHHFGIDITACLCRNLQDRRPLYGLGKTERPLGQAVDQVERAGASPLGSWQLTILALASLFAHVSHMTASMTSRSWLATLALASSSRFRAPKIRTSRPLTTTAPSSALDEKQQSQSQSTTTRSKGQPPQPRPPRPPSAHLSAAAIHSTRSSHHTADKSSSALRQQQQQQQQQHSESSQTSPSSSSSSSREKRPLLRPFELSRRLITLCERGDVDIAVNALQRAPRNAQNIKVWNTIIQQCMSAKKYKLAYGVFTDVCIIIPPLPPPRVFVTCQWLTQTHVVDETSRFRAKCQDVCHDDERLCHC
jgi:hypothetical protein